MPVTAAFGSEFQIVGTTAAGWRIAQNASQSIGFGSVSTTAGVGGSLSSTALGDTVHILCTVANTGFRVLDAVGNLTVV